MSRTAALHCRCIGLYCTSCIRIKLSDAQGPGSGFVLLVTFGTWAIRDQGRRGDSLLPPPPSTSFHRPAQAVQARTRSSRPQLQGKQLVLCIRGEFVPTESFRVRASANWKSVRRAHLVFPCRADQGGSGAVRPEGPCQCRVRLPCRLDSPRCTKGGGGGRGKGQPHGQACPGRIRWTDRRVAIWLAPAGWDFRHDGYSSSLACIERERAVTTPYAILRL